MTLETAQKILDTVKSTPQDWQKINSIPQANIQNMMNDIGEAVYVFDMAGLKDEADELAQYEQIWIDAYMASHI